MEKKTCLPEINPPPNNTLFGSGNSSGMPKRMNSRCLVVVAFDWYSLTFGRACLKPSSPAVHRLESNIAIARKVFQLNHAA